MVAATKSKTTFPLVDALLTIPDEGKDGALAVCTNTTAAGQVLNEINEDLRSNVAVLGSLIVSRDGAERMIINSLVHPTLKYLVLFSEESLTFSPSTNLLQALMHGLDTSKEGNHITGGVAASAQYPNLSKAILDHFRDEIILLPLFMFKSDYSRKIVDEYLEWLKDKVTPNLQQLLITLNQKDKIYYDALNQVISSVAAEPARPKNAVQLDAKDFQHLQPPTIELKNTPETFAMPFEVRAEGTSIRVDIEVGTGSYTITGDEEFLLEYSLMRWLETRKQSLSPLEQLVLGAEIGRVATEIKSNISLPSLLKPGSVQGKKRLPLESKVTLKMDEHYYYRVGLKDGNVSVMCLSFDLCEEVFELRASDLSTLIKRLAELNRFETYEMEVLHRLDVATQIARAAVAAKHGYSFIQDFATIFKVNRTDLPFVVADGDSFLDVHKQVLRKIYTEGLSEEHGDPWKGPARTAVALAIYRDTENSLKTMPKVYQQGDSTPAAIRHDYKKQLLRFDHDGSYSYGERTRTFFGFDQLPAAAEALKTNPSRAVVVQRFDPTVDMAIGTDPETGKMVSSHDPCLTHDIFFVHGGRLHSFHMVRAHNTVNAYPENIFGLYDAYTTTIKRQLSVPSGDMFVLSSRANILLLTEDQRTKKLLGEPSKPMDDRTPTTTGPYRLGKTYKPPATSGSVAYVHQPLRRVSKRPKNPILDRLEKLNGINTLERAITYLATKGVMHNNPILSEYRAGEQDPQGDYLAFFQANGMGGKLHATAVFMNHSLKSQTQDIELCNYLSSRSASGLDLALGKLTLFYVNY